jgi:hypothetical protein
MGHDVWGHPVQSLLSKVLIIYHLFFRRRSYPARAEPSESKSSERPIRFAVRSLGWVEIAEEDLTPERSSKAVNKCIVDLSFGRFDLLDVVGRWGDVSFSHVFCVILFISV